MNGNDNTTQQLHLPVDEPTTRGQMTVPAVPPPPPPPPPPPGPAAPAESVSGRVMVPAGPTGPAGPAEDADFAPAPAAPASGPARGRTRIADDVVERVIQKIVDLAVDEVDGVHGLHPGVEKFFGGAASEGDRAVAVTLADEQATINLSIEVDFGYAVHEVVEQVRTTVISSAERLLGLTIAEVNVVVSDVSFIEPPAGTGAAGTSATGTSAAGTSAAGTDGSRTAGDTSDTSDTSDTGDTGDTGGGRRPGKAPRTRP